MIKGVNHQVVEVNDTACEYFERIIFFVKPEYSFVSEGKIRERAGKIASCTTLPPPTRAGKRVMWREIGKIALSAVLGATAAIIVMKLL